MQNVFYRKVTQKMSPVSTLTSVSEAPYMGKSLDKVWSAHLRSSGLCAHTCAHGYSCWKRHIWARRWRESTGLYTREIHTRSPPRGCPRGRPWRKRRKGGNRFRLKFLHTSHPIPLPSVIRPPGCPCGHPWQKLPICREDGKCFTMKLSRTGPELLTPELCPLLRLPGHPWRKRHIYSRKGGEKPKLKRYVM